MVKQFIKALNFLMAKIYGDAAFYPQIDFRRNTNLKKITQSIRKLEKNNISIKSNFLN